jgi:hypothetical protein
MLSSGGIERIDFSFQRSEIMSEVGMKPLNWKPEPGIGYNVERREDGGMNYTFTDVSHQTLRHWRDFSLEHLYDSDRLTRNLYDLRQVQTIPQEAIQYAIELNSDPSARNIRLAVIVASDEVHQGIEKIQSLTIPGGVEVGIFEDLDSAEEWLSRPISLMA